MKSEKPGSRSRKGGRHGKADRTPSSASPSNPAVKLAIGLVCVMAAVAAFWITTKFLGSPPPVVVETNFSTVPLPPVSTNAQGAAASASAPALTEMTPPPIDTNDPVALINRGTEYLDRGFLDKAIEHYQQALKINPEDEEAHFNLGYAYAKQKNTAKAMEHYREAIRIFPDYGEAHNNLGNILIGQKRHNEAMVHYSAAIRINPDNSSALNNLGRCLGELGRTEEALTQFAEAVRLNPNYVEAHYNLGSTYLVLGKINESVAQFEKLLQIAPGFQPAVTALQRAKAVKAQGGGR